MAQGSVVTGGARGTSGVLIEYARHLIRAWETDGKTLTSLAGQVGVSVGFLSQLKSGRTGIGLGPLERMASAFGMSLAELQSSAAAWADAGRPTASSSPDRGSMASFERAAGAARLLGYPEGAIREVEQVARATAVDLAPEDWLDEIRSSHRRIRLGIARG